MKESGFSFFQRFKRRLNGLGHSRGFGIQSPSDYRFVREVVAEQWPYHAYEDMALAFPQLEKAQRRLNQLYLRISNFVQPDVVLLSDNNYVVTEHLRAGCQRAKFFLTGETQEPYDLLWISAKSCDKISIADVFKQAKEQAAIIVEGIWDDKRAQAVWQQLADSSHATVGFDLFGCGIIFLRPKRNHCLYIINP